MTLNLKFPVLILKNSFIINRKLINKKTVENHTKFTLICD
jgi:hypothetical protein